MAIAAPTSLAAPVVATHRQWVTTTELLGILGISRSTLFRCKRLFRAGVHYRLVNPGALRSQRRWSVAAVNEALLQASKRGRG